MAPLGLVTLTLVALVVVPIVADAYTRPLFEELRTVAAPAQQLLTRVHVALALEGSALRDFAETQNPVFAVRFREARRRQLEAQAQLRTLVSQLGPAVQQRYAGLRDASHRWHDAADRVLSAAVTGGGPTSSLPDRLYEDLLIAAAGLSESLDQAVQGRRARIREAGQLQRWTSVVLSGLALLALGAVALLARRLRAAAAAAEDGRRTVERLMESKTRLIRGISHDLKNPLNAIDGYGALLTEGVKGELTPEQRKCVTRIRASAGAVLALVEDLLALSQAEAGQLHVLCRPTDIRAAVADAVDEHRAAAEAAGHSLVLSIPDDIAMSDTDPGRLRQVLGNLLSNAIKYTPSGGRIDVQVEGDRRSRVRPPASAVAVHVTDTGPGIPPSQLDAVFEEFTRFDTTGRRGAGLGLAIARRIARLLGGDLTVESEVGRGSRFTLWLPEHCPPRGAGISRPQS